MLVRDLRLKKTAAADILADNAVVIVEVALAVAMSEMVANLVPACLPKLVEVPHPLRADWGIRTEDAPSRSAPLQCGKAAPLGLQRTRGARAPLVPRIGMADIA